MFSANSSICCGKGSDFRIDIESSNLIDTQHKLRLTLPETKRLARFLGSHPLLEMDTCERLFKTVRDKYEPKLTVAENFERNLGHARLSLNRFLDCPPKIGLHHHVDIIAKRQSKSELTLLIDKESDPIPNNLHSFLMSPVHQNLILSPRLRNVREWQKSMSFPNLAHAIDMDLPVQSICHDCDTVSLGDTFACASMDCKGRTSLHQVTASINPGNNRQYFGPVVPTLGRVWVGVVDKMIHRNERIGLIQATVYSLFHDQADVNRRGRVALKFPNANPRIQWAIFPISRGLYTVDQHPTKTSCLKPTKRHCVC